MSDEEFLEIEEQASKLCREFCRNKVTQDIRGEEYIGFWIAKIAYEKGWNDRYNTLTTKDI